MPSLKQTVLDTKDLVNKYFHEDVWKGETITIVPSDVVNVSLNSFLFDEWEYLQELVIEELRLGDICFANIVHEVLEGMIVRLYGYYKLDEKNDRSRHMYDLRCLSIYVYCSNATTMIMKRIEKNSKNLILVRISGLREMENNNSLNSCQLIGEIVESEKLIDENNLYFHSVKCTYNDINECQLREVRKVKIIDLLDQISDDESISSDEMTQSTTINNNNNERNELNYEEEDKCENYSNNFNTLKFLRFPNYLDLKEFYDKDRKELNWMEYHLVVDIINRNRNRAYSMNEENDSEIIKILFKENRLYLSEQLRIRQIHWKMINLFRYSLNVLFQTYRKKRKESNKYCDKLKLWVNDLKDEENYYRYYRKIIFSSHNLKEVANSLYSVRRHFIFTKYKRIIEGMTYELLNGKTIPLREFTIAYQSMAIGFHHDNNIKKYLNNRIEQLNCLIKIID
ncbi:hypothetical protein SNEBB_004210 [Seison nebaliae]|nr:hypothetical protein SNEBB_004210 [Seison nebaliae]